MFESTRDFDVDAKEWGMDKLRKYIAYCRTQFKPRMSRDARRVVTRYWEMQRGNDQRNVARTTVRMLESLVRITQVIFFKEEGLSWLVRWFL